MTKEQKEKLKEMSMDLINRKDSKEWLDFLEDDVNKAIKLTEEELEYHKWVLQQIKDKKRKFIKS